MSSPAQAAPPPSRVASSARAPRAAAHHALRLRPGADLVRELEAYAAREGLRAAFVATCVGSLSRSALRFAGRPGADVREEPFEICSLVGTLGVGAKPHLHLALADARGAMVGGHALEGGVVRTTAEVVLGELEGLDFSRPIDEESTYDELHVALADRSSGGKIGGGGAAGAGADAEAR